MEALADYGSDPEDESFGQTKANGSSLESKVQLPAGSARPVYPVSGGSSGGRAYVPSSGGDAQHMHGGALVLAPLTADKAGNHVGSAAVATNQRITSEVYAPVEGPVNPNKKAGVDPRTGFGQLQQTAVDEYVFNQEFHANEGQGRRHGRRAGTKDKNGSSDTASDEPKAKKKKKGADRLKDALKAVDDVGDEYSDPWAQPSEGSEESKRRKADMEAIDARKAKLEEEKKKEADEKREKEASEKYGDGEEGASVPVKAVEASSKFHGESMQDYQGRAWTHPPPGIKPRDQEEALSSEAYVPKKCSRKFTGHNKGVNAVQFIPGTGHLLLSAGQEGKCKIWDVYGDRNVRQTYHGHGAAVKSVAFSSAGGSFLSSGFDRVIRLWDTETGQAVNTFGNNSIGYCVKYNPNDNNEFLVAASDNRVYGWDARTGSVVQEYNYHLKAVSHVSFYDDGRRFFSTSDDKKILCWEYGVPVPTKYIADPDMYSIPTCTMHPSQESFAGQSMDNRVVVYSCKDADKVRLNKKKSFGGHNVAGYACGLTFSPNGQYLAGGDSVGLLYVWDWKTTQVYRKFQAHDRGPCMDCAWHPLQPSWLATCGWDGVVKLWQ